MSGVGYLTSLAASSETQCFNCSSLHLALRLVPPPFPMHASISRTTIARTHTNRGARHMAHLLVHLAANQDERNIPFTWRPFRTSYSFPRLSSS